MAPLIHLLTALFALFATALPSTLTTESATITIAFARNTQCTPDGTPTTHVTAGAGCVAFPPGAQSLRVVAVGDDHKLRYNSLRVYSSGDCSGGWTLEPALTCAGKGCACSHVGAFGSVQLVV